MGKTWKESERRMNEPVAWIDPKELDMDVSTSVTKTKQFDTDIPLYMLRELTDEEIGEFKGQWYRGDFNSFYDLVQAILKKASE